MSRSIQQQSGDMKPGSVSRTNTSHYQTSKPISTSNGPSTTRPILPARETDYMSMLLALDTIPRLHNILVSFFTWLLLAGFLIFPGTFTTISTLHPTSTTESTIILSVKHIPLLVIASICTVLGAAGMLWLWYIHHDNYVWVLNRIFLPGCLNSIAGAIGTLVNVYAQNDGHWSVTATVTACVTGGIAVVTGGLFGVYNFWVLEGVKKRHVREMGDETRMQKIHRFSHEPGIGGMDSVV